MSITRTPIFVSLGKKRYVGGTVTEKDGNDISGDTFTVALGTSNTIPPSSGWVVPGVNQAGKGGSSTRLLLFLVDNNVDPGVYWIWANIVDNPEIEPLVLDGPITVA